MLNTENIALRFHLPCTLSFYYILSNYHLCRIHDWQRIDAVKVLFKQIRLCLRHHPTTAQIVIEAQIVTLLLDIKEMVSIQLFLFRIVQNLPLLQHLVNFPSEMFFHRPCFLVIVKAALHHRC